MSYGPILTIFLEGNLTSNVISVRVPHKDIGKHLWQFSIHEISFNFSNSNSEINALIALKTNFLKDVHFDSNRELETYFPIIHMFDFKIKANTSFIKVVRPEKCWRYINNVAEDLEFYFDNISSIKKHKPANFNCIISCIVFVQRVK